MKQELYFENGDLTGEISLTLKDGKTLNDFFSKYLHDYNPDRMEPYAVRFIFGKENVLTLFAVDNFKQENSTILDADKIPVKKYKIPGVSFSDILDCFGEFNFTVSTNNYSLESLQVINK